MKQSPQKSLQIQILTVILRRRQCLNRWEDIGLRKYWDAAGWEPSILRTMGSLIAKWR